MYSMVSDVHRNDEINQLISDYKQNMKAFYITIEKFVQDNESLKYYFTKVISSRSKITSLDQIKADKMIQRKYSSEIKKFIGFYNEIICEENSFLYNGADVETSINILYSTDEKLNNKLQEIYRTYELEFEEKSDQSIEINNYIISFPKENTSEKNRFDFSNLSFRNEIQY